MYEIGLGALAELVMYEIGPGALSELVMDEIGLGALSMICLWYGRMLKKVEIKRMNQDIPRNFSGFSLQGFTDQQDLQVLIFITFLILYFIILLGNVTIFSLIIWDSHLHTPMYIFLMNLSLIDITYTSNVLPKLLDILLTRCKTISFAGCITQMYIFVSLSCTEVLLLAAMAYDRYVAICHPLHYLILMSFRQCATLLFHVWVLGFLTSTGHAVLISRKSFCMSHLIDHFFCDVTPLLKISSSDTSDVEMLSYIEGVLVVFPTLLVTFISYVRIISSILKIKSSEGRSKAFSTCTSHLTCVTIFYGTLMSMNMRPKSSTSPKQDKFFALLYIVLVPMLNPFIYSLKNQDVKNAYEIGLGALAESVMYEMGPGALAESVMYEMGPGALAEYMMYEIGPGH
ncbi:olfactory receptor 5AR1-like [Pelodytes ibericus]